MKSSKWNTIWADRSVALQMLGLLAPHDVTQVIQVNKTCRRCIQWELRRFRRASVHLGLTLWVRQHVVLEFQSQFQELETHQIARSAVRDPRVPPRVVSVWAERGPVPGGVMTLRPESLPKRNEHGFALRFTSDGDPKPMLTSVVQTGRRIYTVVTVKIVRGEKETVLRRLGYLREFGEWRSLMPAADKRRLDDQGALCRYDLVSLDGGIALELDVPRGTDSMMDYYLVKGAAVMLPMKEVMYPLFKKVRPTRPLPSPGTNNESTRSCILVISFGRLDGTVETTYRIAADLIVEDQSQSPQTPSSPSPPQDNDIADTESSVSTDRAPHRRTGIESFDIVTIKSIDQAKMDVPLTPGYLWISVVDDHTTTSKASFYYTIAMLHNGASRSRASLILDAQWVPGTLEFFPTPESRQRRSLKGFFHLSVNMDTHNIEKLTLVAQHLPATRLEPYAAAIESYTRP